MTKKISRKAEPTLRDRLHAVHDHYVSESDPPDDGDSFLEHADRILARKQRMQKDAWAAARRDVIPLIPVSVADPKSVATETYAMFDRCLDSSRSYDDAKRISARWSHDMGILATALRHFNDHMTHFSNTSLLDLSHEAWKRGIDLEVLSEQLHVLGEIAASVEGAHATGRAKAHNTTAALEAAQYLMDHGIKRQRAAKIVAVLTFHHPDVAAKDWRTIQTAMVDAGISARTKKLGKGSRKGYISLTPG